MAADLSQRSDAELVRAFRAGNAQALGALVERHLGVIHLIGYSVLKSREAAEDLAQETFLRALLSLERLDRPGRFSAWLTQIARNLAVDWYRQGQTRSRLIPLVPMGKATAEVPYHWGEGVHEAMANREEQAGRPPAQRDRPAPRGAGRRLAGRGARVGAARRRGADPA